MMKNFIKALMIAAIICNKSTLISQDNSKYRTKIDIEKTAAWFENWRYSKKTIDPNKTNHRWLHKQSRNKPKWEKLRDQKDERLRKYRWKADEQSLKKWKEHEKKQQQILDQNCQQLEMSIQQKKDLDKKRNELELHTHQFTNDTIRWLHVQWRYVFDSSYRNEWNNYNQKLAGTNLLIDQSKNKITAVIHEKLNDFEYNQAELMYIEQFKSNKDFFAPEAMRELDCFKKRSHFGYVTLQSSFNKKYCNIYHKINLEKE